MQSDAERAAGQPEAAILRALGFFDRPAEPDALKLVLPPMEPGLYRAALGRLQEARLVLAGNALKLWKSLRVYLLMRFVARLALIAVTTHPQSYDFAEVDRILSTAQQQINVPISITLTQGGRTVLQRPMATPR